MNNRHLESRSHRPSSSRSHVGSVALALFATLFMSMSVIACSKSGGGDVATPPPGGPTGTGVVATQCQIGQIYNAQYGCLYQQGCTQPNHGWVPGQGMCVPGTLITVDQVHGAGYGTNFKGSLGVSNRDAFSRMLQYAGLCNPYWVGWNWGDANCNTWSTSGFMHLNIISGQNSGNFTIGAGTSNPDAYNPFYGALTGFARALILNQRAKLYDYNNSQGMYVEGVDYAGTRVGLRGLVEVGRPDTSYQFDITLEYQGAVIARGTLRRY